MGIKVRVEIEVNGREVVVEEDLSLRFMNVSNHKIVETLDEVVAKAKIAANLSEGEDK